MALTKAAEIRKLSREDGLSPTEIIARGFNRATVYAVLRPKLQRDRPSAAVLAEILEVVLDIQARLRRQAGEKVSFIDRRPEDPPF